MSNQKSEHAPAPSEPVGDPTKAPEFQRVLGNMLKSPPKPQSEMKVGKPKAKAKVPGASA